MTVDFDAITRKALEEGIQKLVVGAAIPDASNRLLILRRKQDDFMGRIYELPSGGVEGAESLEQALLREVTEETGLYVDSVLAHIGSFEYLSKSGKRTRQHNFIVRARTGEIRLSEHDAYAWIKEQEINDYNLTHEVKSVIRKGYEWLNQEKA